jgi:plastocyanin domain-containing protein
MPLEGSRAPASAQIAPADPRALNAVTPSAGMEAHAIRRKGVQEVAVIAGDAGFFPKTVFVTRDIPVRLYVTGASKNTLCLMMDSFQVRKQIRSQKIEEISFTPGIPGKYRFHCPVNGMEGNLIVRELAAVEGE